MDKYFSKKGVLLVNLGTPDEPTPKAVKRYLAQFLHDKRVIDYTRWLWCPILHFVILPFRSKRSAKAYQKIWQSDGSPLLTNSQEIADGLSKSSNLPVELAMTYGRPDIDSALQALTQKGVNQLLVLPLYPQYSSTTTAAVFDAVAKALKSVKTIPELRFINDYCEDAAYIDALAQTVEQFWEAKGRRSEKLIMSFHGIPQRYVAEGDIYQQQCQRCAELLAEKLGLSQEQWLLTYQSRVGREEWLKPYTDQTLEQLPQQGCKAVDVICPAFAVDCLETLEEIAMENKDIFLAAGGESYDYIPALNAQPEHINALLELINKHTNNWE